MGVVSAEDDLTDGIFPVVDLVPVILRGGFHAAVPADDAGRGSPAPQLGAAAAKYACQIGHEASCVISIILGVQNTSTMLSMAV